MLGGGSIAYWQATGRCEGNEGVLASIVHEREGLVSHMVSHYRPPESGLHDCLRKELYGIDGAAKTEKARRADDECDVT